MSMTLSGDGTITGLVAGGLPDATIQTADIVDGNITAAKLSGAQTGSAPIYGCRAWAVINGATTGTYSPTLPSGNIATIQRVAAGVYAFTFTTAMPDANYTILGTCNSNVGVRPAYVTSNTGAGSAFVAPTTAGFTILVHDTTAAVDVAAVSVAIFR